ncbi:MAG: WD40 repeat domain-containing protein [Campylobacterota bacterium]
MTPHKRVSIPDAIHKIKAIAQDKIGIVSVDNSFRVVRLDDFKTLGGFKTLIPKNNPNIANCDIANNGAFVCLYDAQKACQLIYYVKTKQSVYALQEHQGMVESCSFAAQSIHLLTGGQDGKVYLWNMKNGQMVSSLTPHADFVSATAFSDNGHWVASGGFDNQIFVTNISSMNQQFTLRGHKGAIKVVRFLKKQRLLVADKEGELVVWNYTTQTVVTRLAKMLDEVTCLTLSDDERFLFVADKTKRVSLYDLKRYEVIQDSICKLNASCTAMQYIPFNNTLVLGLRNGELLFFDIYEGKERVAKYIEDKAYEKAYKMIEHNPVLQFTSLYDDLEQQWELEVGVAQRLLQEGKQKEAKALLQPFSVNSQKRLFIQKIMKDFAAFEKFKAAASAKKYPLAYSIVAQYRALEDTKHYKLMENEWQKALRQVKQVVATKDGEQKAQEILKPFKGVSSKAQTIQSIFEQRQIITLFQKKVAEQSYGDAIALTKKHTFLKSFDDYEKLMQVSKQLESQAQEYISSGKYSRVLQVCEKLESFPQMKDKAKQLKGEATVYAQAMSLYAEKDFSTLYKMVEKHPFLEDMQMLIKMENSWNKRVFQAENLAVRGKIEKIKELFHNFLKIEVKVPKIASILQLAYQNQILQSLKDPSTSDTKIKAALERVIYLFGINELVFDCVKDIKKIRQKFSFNVNLVMQEGDAFSWVKKELPDNIMSSYNE